VKEEHKHDISDEAAAEYKTFSIKSGNFLAKI